MVIVTALTLAINSWVTLDMANDVAANNELLSLDSKCQFTSFDYIIVGAGGAGMVVATRIANASRTARVLLLEAGGEPSILNQIPSMDFFLLNQEGNTWIYNSTVQSKACQNCDGKKTLTTRGKMLGGSTSTNFMMYVRGNKEDFNRWAADAGDNSWNYENLLPYFKKSEDYNGAYAGDASSSQYHGTGGLLNIATHDYMPGADEFLAAAAEKGYTIGDYNGENQEVFSKIDVTTQDGWRESTYRAFYTDTGKPSNLCIKKYAHVTKINFRNVGGKPRATGVTYQRHNLTRTVTARKEVIVSAGTFGSPKLLLLSGVGPASHLQSLKIPVVKDLPVGTNLQDHTYTIVGPFMKTPSLNPNRDVTAQAAAEFLLSGNGALAAPAGLAGVGFFKSPFAQPDYADLQVVQFAVALYPELPRDLNKFFGIKTQLLDNWFNPYHKQNTDARFLVLWLGRPKSTGTLTLASTNPQDNPNIDPQYLAHPDDAEALLHGFKKVVDLYETSNALNTTIFPKPVPGCESLTFKSDDYYRCVIKNFSGSLYHHVGTCALGKVVDSKLKVKGIDSLRVIDASVIPRTPNANTQASTIMTAEKGSDLIIADM
ncbi:Glucose dehydrogenase [FAD, quinone] [Orchesella cincta]|uniref:Glucose dehydrogenase [FAD, quinone] n=1 Tax=Orchesella cincta TaxID=48709 RepID=A0A1D2MET7_ORCCI|nr:Glucose dehydrogenase [FAD, quinone] [Orchesella cincta]